MELELDIFFWLFSGMAMVITGCVLYSWFDSMVSQQVVSNVRSGGGCRIIQSSGRGSSVVSCSNNTMSRGSSIVQSVSSGWNGSSVSVDGRKYSGKDVVVVGSTVYVDGNKVN